MSNSELNQSLPTAPADVRSNGSEAAPGADAPLLVEEPAAGDGNDAQASAPVKKRFFGRRKKASAEQGELPGAAGEFDTTDAGTPTVLRSAPIRILMGYLPDVRERDARDYALGVAEKHFDQPAMAFYDAFRLGDGYAYEVHEGGDGVAYLPQIIKYFDSLGPYRPDAPAKVTIRTGTRMVEVERQAKGLSAILLPESSTKEPTPWLAPRERMSPALNQRTRFLVVSAVFFVTGFFALAGSMISRHQPYDAAPPAAVVKVSYEDLPISRWTRLQALPSNSYVAKVEFADKRWKALDIRNATPAQAAPVEVPAPVAPEPQVVPPAPAPLPNGQPQ